MSAPVLAPVVPASATAKPPRLNLAGFCIYCFERACEDPACRTAYERSTWVVCPACTGSGYDGDGSPCDCVLGLRPARLVDLGPATRDRTSGGLTRDDIGAAHWGSYLLLRRQQERELRSFLREVSEHKRSSRRERGAHIAGSMRALRKARGLSQFGLIRAMQDLAAQQNISLPDEDCLKVYVSRWENQVTVPTRRAYVELLEAILLPDTAPDRPGLRVVPIQTVAS